MRTIFIDGDLYKTPGELHAALKKMLSLPEYYGMNADALNDCISEIPDTVNACIVSRGQGAVADTVEKVCRVIDDNGGSIRELQ